MEIKDVNIEKKLASFEETINRKVAKRCAAIKEELELFKAQEQRIYNMDIEKDTKVILATEATEMAAENARELSHRKTEYRHMLYQKRDEYFNEIFNEVQKNLIEFCKTEDYKEFLLNKIRKFRDECAMENSEIIVKTEDLKYEQEIKDIYGMPCTVKASDTIKIGGAIFCNKENGLLIEENLSSILKRQKELFHQESGMSITI